MFLHETMTAPKTSNLAVRKADFRLPSRDQWDKRVAISLGEFLVLAHKLRAEVEPKRQQRGLDEAFLRS